MLEEALGIEAHGFLGFVAVGAEQGTLNLGVVIALRATSVLLDEQGFGKLGAFRINIVFEIGYGKFLLNNKIGFFKRLVAGQPHKLFQVTVMKVAIVPHIQDFPGESEDLDSAPDKAGERPVFSER